jgi:hypothetical protein
MNVLFVSGILGLSFVISGGCSQQTRTADVQISQFDKPGFTTIEQDGRLWIFQIGSEELADFRQHGELAKHVTCPAAGPQGMTVKAPDMGTIQAYMSARPGYVTFVEDGRLWVFEEGSEELQQYREHGELAKHVTKIGVGPMGMTVKGPDSDVVNEYLCCKPGYVTDMVDGRLWVFAAGSPELADFQQHGELAKHVTCPAAGPHGLTVKAPDMETVRNYMASAPGFVTMIDDGRIWVFRPGSEELANFRQHGELAKHVMRIKAGPMGMTVKAPDTNTLNAYLRTVSQ